MIVGLLAEDRDIINKGTDASVNNSISEPITLIIRNDQKRGRSDLSDSEIKDKRRETELSLYLLIGLWVKIIDMDLMALEIVFILLFEKYLELVVMHSRINHKDNSSA
jgi:uncharacterized membrane protein YqjE